VNRLRSLVIGEGMLHEGNIYLIDFALKKMPPLGCVIEIGSYGGLSTNLILYLLKVNNRTEHLLNCDPWIYEGFNDKSETNPTKIDGRTDISRIEYAEYMRNAFVKGVEFLNKENLPYSFQLSSDEFFHQYKHKTKTEDLFGRTIQLGSPISFAYIDGNHQYDFVKRDFEHVDEFLMESGFILFDDSMDGLPFGSARFMQEMRKNKRYQFIRKNPNYLFQKR
jgi:hypothetical protein